MKNIKEKKKTFKKGGISKQGSTLSYITIGSWLKPNLKSSVHIGLLALLEKQIRKPISFRSPWNKMSVIANCSDMFELMELFIHH